MIHVKCFLKYCNNAMPITEIAHHFKKVAKRLGMMTGWYGLGRK
jgi:hypothetical protein